MIDYDEYNGPDSNHSLLDCSRVVHLLEANRICLRGFLVKDKEGNCALDRLNVQSKSPYSMKILRILNEGCQKHQLFEPEDPTFIAARLGMINNLNWMKSKYISTVKCKPFGYTTLHAAAEFGQLEAFKLIADDLTNKNPADKMGYTPLHVASREGHIEIVEYLIEWSLKKNHDINPRTENGFTPLELACGSGHLDVLKALAEAGADINDLHGKHILNVAAISGFYGCLDWLLTQFETEQYFSKKECKVDNVPIQTFDPNGKSDLDIISTFDYIDRDNDETGFLPIHEACKSGNVKATKRIVQHMLKVGQTEINVQSKEGITPLHLAAKAGRYILCEWLLSGDGFKIDNLAAKDMFGMTAFDYAIGLGELGVARLLANISRGRKPRDRPPTRSVTDYDNCNDQFIPRLGTKEKKEGLKQNELFATMEDCKRPLMVAATHGCTKAVESFLDFKHHEFLKVCTSSDYLELVMAMSLTYGWLETAKVLFEKMDSEDRNPCREEIGFTPLHFAIRGRYTDVIDWIIEDGQLKNTKSLKDGSTPLHDACKAGFADLAAKIIKLVDVNHKDFKGKTAFDYANEYGHKSCQKLILTSNIDPALATSEEYKQYSLLEHAICSGKLDLAKRLLYHLDHRELGYKCAFGFTALQWAMIMQKDDKDNETKWNEIIDLMKEMQGLRKLPDVPKVPFAYSLKTQIED